MGFGRVARFCVTAPLLLAASPQQAVGHLAAASLTGREIAQVLKGKTCTTKGGATFMFGDDGHFVYSGLWRNGGRYSIENGGVTVTFESGLERFFAISRKEGVLYMEQTAMTCAVEALKSTS